MADSKSLVLRSGTDSTDRWVLRRSVFFLAIPAVGEQVLNTAVGVTDQFLVGHLDPAVAQRLGYDPTMGLAAVGLGNLVVWITTTLFIAIAVGATAVVARRIGEGAGARANQALQQALLFSLFLGAFSTLVVWLGADLILQALGAGPDVRALGADYLRIVALSFIPTAFVFAGTAALRGAGDTRSPLYMMAVVNTINIALSWLLVNGNLGFPGLGVAGSAIGTAVGRSLAGVILLLLFFVGKMRLQVAWTWRPEWDTMRKILKVGLPSSGEQFVFQGAIVFMTGLITALGTAAYAAHSVTITIESVSFLPGFGFAIAATAMVGQALGARDPEYAERATREAFLQGGAMMSILGIVMALWPATLISLIAPDPEVIQQATGPLRLAGLAQPLLALSFIYIGALRGAGDTTWPLMMRIVSTWLIRLPLTLLLLHFTGWGLFGVWVAMTADMCAQSILVWLRFRDGHWKHIAL